MNTILIEEEQFQFLSPELPRPISFIRRFSQGSKRYYYTISDEGNASLYSSGTTLIKDGYAQDTMALEAWRNKLKSEGKNPEYELTYLAGRGTLLHVLVGEYIQGREIEINDLKKYFFEKHPSVSVPYMNEILLKDSEWLVKGVLAFGQFVKDYNVKALAIELMMKSEKYKVASPIDFLGTIDIDEEGPWGEPLKSGPNKGQPKIIKRKKTILAIIDFKSSQNGFYDSHALQLLLYKDIVKENYPNLNIEGIYNWSPKDFRTSPTYNFKDQSDHKLTALAEVVFEQGRIKHSFKDPTVTTYTEFVDMTTFDGETIFKTIPLIEYLEQKHKKEDDGTEGGDKDSK